MITIDRISFSYGDKSVLSDFSAEIHSPGVSCITGPSGSGKTTLMHLICGLIRPDSGTVSGLSPGEAAIVFQEDRLLPWCSVTENVLAVMPKGAKAEDAGAFLKMARLTGENLAFPGALSGGMKRRLALARALAYGGRLLALDEPFKGMDNPLRQSIMDMLLRVSESTPILLLTHNEEELSYLGGRVIAL